MRAHAVIRATTFHVPDGVVDNDALAKEFPEWSVDKIESKTGITRRHIAAATETSCDLAVAAARKLFASGACAAEDVDFVLLCTQSPDHFLPTTACIVQDRLGIPTTAGAFDFSLGCSGFIYGLSVAKGLIETNQARNVLLLTAETYSKFIHPADKSVRTLFGDAAAATLVAAEAPTVSDTSRGREELIGPFVFGTDGSGAQNLIVPSGAMRLARSAETALLVTDDSGNVRSDDHLYMNGAEIFNFTLRRVPHCVSALLEKASITMEQVDRFIFHQANAYMLEHLRRKIGVPKEKFVTAFESVGNTVSSTIPIALHVAVERGEIEPGHRVMLVGFGVGYSWGATLIRWGSR